MKSSNHNIFVGDRPYKTNFFLKFRSARTETKFLQEVFIRNRFPIQGFLFFTLLCLALQFMTSDCFQYDTNCRYRGLLLITMGLVVLGFALLRIRRSPYYLRACILAMSIYPQVLILDRYHYDTALILLSIYTSIASIEIYITDLQA